ncbi:MAG: L,D-transpeptidase [Rhizobiaceae bacterium]
MYFNTSKRRLVSAALFGASCVAMMLGQTSEAEAGRIVARVDISQQVMTVYQDGRKKYSWKVSTARRGKVTPRGSWKAKWLSRHHRSSRYNNAPMPYSIFYNGNFAVHGTNQISRLGRPASAGCIRLHPKNAAVLFRLAQSYGLRNTIVRVVD